MNWIIISTSLSSLFLPQTLPVMHGHDFSQILQTVICLSAPCHCVIQKSAERVDIFSRLCLPQLIMHSTPLSEYGFMLNGSFLPFLILAIPSTLTYIDVCTISYTSMVLLSYLGIRSFHGDQRSTLSNLSFDLSGVISLSDWRFASRLVSKTTERGETHEFWLKTKECYYWWLCQGFLRRSNRNWVRTNTRKRSTGRGLQLFHANHGMACWLKRYWHLVWEARYCDKQTWYCRIHLWPSSWTELPPALSRGRFLTVWRLLHNWIPSSTTPCRRC